MVRSRVGLRVAGVRTAWRIVDDGDFFCAGCGGDRCYRLLTGRRRLTVLGLPVLPRGAAEPVVECVSCRGHFPPDALGQPTTTRLAGLLRDAVYAIALAMLGAGGGEEAAARRAAVAVIRDAGYPECTEDGLLTLRAAMGRRRLPPLDHEVRAAVGALTPHLAAPGREALLLLGARVALADGPCTDAERQTLSTIAEALSLPVAATERLLGSR